MGGRGGISDHEESRTIPIGLRGCLDQGPMAGKEDTNGEQTLVTKAQKRVGKI